MAEGTRMLQRGATEAVWNTSSYVLAARELGVATDTGVIKIGDGVNTWVNLDPAFSDYYLPLLGTASNSELLGGISSSGFLQAADATTGPTANKIARRLSDGRLQAAAGVSGNDVVNFGQMNQTLVSRSISANSTLVAGDVGKLMVVENPNYTPTLTLTIPTNASLALPVGSSVEVLCPNKGSVAFVGASGVTVAGSTVIYGNGSFARLVKVNTDLWRVVDVTYSPAPVLKRRIKEGSDNTIPNNAFTKMRLDGADSGTALFSNSFDSLGVNEQWSGADVYKVFCRRSGYYHVDAQASLGGGTPAGRAYVQLRVNDTAQDLGSGAARTAQELQPHFHGLIPLNAGDFIEVYVFQDSATTATIVTSAYAPSYFNWNWVRPL